MLPWNLVVTSRCLYSLKDCNDGRADGVKRSGCESDQENSFNKRRKCEYVPLNGTSCSLQNLNGTIREAASFVKLTHLQGRDSNSPVLLPMFGTYKNWRESQDGFSMIFEICFSEQRWSSNIHHTRFFWNLSEIDIYSVILTLFFVLCNGGVSALSSQHNYDSFYFYRLWGYYILKNEQSCASSKNIKYEEL